jgi:hypothetical protein
LPPVVAATDVALDGLPGALLWLAVAAAARRAHLDEEIDAEFTAVSELREKPGGTIGITATEHALRFQAITCSIQAAANPPRRSRWSSTLCAIARTHSFAFRSAFRTRPCDRRNREDIRSTTHKARLSIERASWVEREHKVLLRLPTL